MVKRRSKKINTYPYVLYINCRKRQTIVKITITPLNTLRDITQRVFKRVEKVLKDFFDTLKNYLPFYRAYHIINVNQRPKHTDSR